MNTSQALARMDGLSSLEWGDLTRGFTGGQNKGYVCDLGRVRAFI